MSEPFSDPIGTPDPNAPSAPTATPASTTGLPPNIAALIATLFPLIGGVIMIVLEKRNKFVRFWAMQSLLFGALTFGVALLVKIAFGIFYFIPFLGKLLIVVLGAVNLAYGIALCVVYVICAYKAFSNLEWEIPWLGKIARQQLARMDLAAPAATA